MNAHSAKAAKRVALLGFGDFQRTALVSYLRLSQNRVPTYKEAATLADADFVIADADHAGTIDAVLGADRVADTVFIGSLTPDGALAWMMRPIDTLQVFRELDAHRRTAHAAGRGRGTVNATHKIIAAEHDIARDDLGRLAGYINERFAGHTLDDIRKMLIEEMSNDRVLCDNLISEAMALCKDVFSISDSDIFTSGLSEALNLPDFCDIGRIRGLLRTLEDKHIILKLLEQISDTEGTQVFIGSENPLDEMKQFSLVAATYREGNRPIGAIGIIGPTRMNSSQAITLVDTTARFITDIYTYYR